MKEQAKIFEQELNLILREDIRKFTESALDILPDYFWEMPASTTGKYHPAYSLGKGGLVRHEKGAIQFALELFPFKVTGEYNDLEKDIIISALLLHDGVKCGMNGSKYTVVEHPLEVTQLIRKHPEVMNLLDNKIAECILGCIESHMSQWNTNRSGRVVLPDAKTGLQKFVAMCDYLASRKRINLDLDMPTKRES